MGITSLKIISYERCHINFCPNVNKWIIIVAICWVVIDTCSFFILLLPQKKLIRHIYQKILLDSIIRRMGGGKSGVDRSPLIQSQDRSHGFDQETTLEEGYYCCISAEYFEEVKQQLWLAGPLVAVSLLQYFLQVISIMFVGHLGELPLSSASLATSFASVTGFSVLVTCFFFFSLQFSIIRLGSNLIGAHTHWHIWLHDDVCALNGLGLESKALF